MKLALLVFTCLLLVFVRNCDCKKQSVTGTGKTLCEHCPETPTRIECASPALNLAKQDATSKAKAECDRNGGTLSGPDKWEESPAECVREGSNWFVRRTATGTFKCCPK